MKIETIPLPSKNIKAEGLCVSWDDGQFVMIITDKGIISCGILDIKVADKFGFLATVSRGTPEKPLKTIDDLLSAKILEVSQKAKNFGIEVGMTAKQALEILDK